MQLKIRKKFLAHAHDTKILHDKAVRSNPVKIRQEPVKPFGFIFFANCIYGNINFFALAVNALNGRLKFPPGKIGGSHPSIKTFQSKINGIGTFTDCSVQGLNISGRC